MPLSAILDESAFTGLADETVLGKDLYLKNEKDGNYVLAMDGAEAGKLAKPLQVELEKLQRNNKALLDEKVAKMKELDPWQRLGKTPEELDELIKTGRVAGVDEVEKKYTAQIDSLKTEHQRALEAAAEQANGYKSKADEVGGQLRMQTLSTKIAQLRTDFGGNTLADDYLKNRLRVVPESEGSDKYVIRVFDDNGEVAYKGTQFKTPEQLIEEAKANKDLAGMFNGGTGGGSGAPARQLGSQGNAKTMTREQFDGLGSVEQHKFLVTDKGQVVG